MATSWFSIALVGSLALAAAISSTATAPGSRVGHDVSSASPTIAAPTPVGQMVISPPTTAWPPTTSATTWTAPPPIPMAPTLHATLMPETVSVDFVPTGTVVPRTDVFATASASQMVLFGLAELPLVPGATYPVISTDSGGSWRVDGPRFHINAADGPDQTGSIGVLGPDGAYAWGEGGNVVKVTTDGGMQWWETGFSYGVKSVNLTDKTLSVIALGNQTSNGLCEDFRYVSNDAGRTWSLEGRLPDITC
jgi:hypothetical protein